MSLCAVVVVCGLVLIVGVDVCCSLLLSWIGVRCWRCLLMFAVVVCVVFVAFVCVSVLNFAVGVCCICV